MGPGFLILHSSVRPTFLGCLSRNKPRDFFQRPNVASNPGVHRRRDAQRLVDASEIVIHEVQRNGVHMIVHLLAERGGAIQAFVRSKVMADFVGSEIRKKLENPLKFQVRPVASENLVSIAYGYDVALLIDICKAIVAAEAAGSLTSRQASAAAQAHTILGA